MVLQFEHNYKWSYICPINVVLDFLEILSNYKQLYCKHLNLIILLRRPHGKNKETPLWVWAETATEIQAIITQDLLSQNL